MRLTRCEFKKTIQLVYKDLHHSDIASFSLIVKVVQRLNNPLILTHNKSNIK